jgi:hypothetical protein
MLTVLLFGLGLTATAGPPDQEVSPQAEPEIKMKQATAEQATYGPNMLYAHYTFDEGGKDELGNVNLTLHGASSLTDHFKGTVAMLSDKDSAYLKSEAPLLSDTLTEMTFSTWLYLEEGNEGGDDWEPIYEFYNSVSTQHEYLSGNLWASNYGLISSSPDWIWVSAEPKLENDTWYHLAVTREGTNATVYLDGAVYATGDVGKTIGELEADEFYFGGNPTEGREYKYVNGMYDDIMIFHQALTVDQVMELTKINPPIPDLDKPTNFEGASAWYPLDSNGVDAIGDHDITLYDETYIRNYGGRGDVVVFNELDTTYGIIQGNIPVTGEKFTFGAWIYWDSEYAEPLTETTSISLQRSNGVMN